MTIRGASAQVAGAWSPGRLVAWRGGIAAYLVWDSPRRAGRVMDADRIEPLLPVVPRRADHPGRNRLDDRRVLCGVLFVLYTGIPWEFLPQELGFWVRDDLLAAAAGLA